VNRLDLVSENVANKLAVAQALGQTDFDVHVSVDPTQIGQSLDPGLARDNARRIAEEIRRASGNRPGVHCLMFDMEDASVIDATIALHNELKKGALPVALTLRACLRHAGADEPGNREAGGGRAQIQTAYTRQEDKANFRHWSN
jgi:proline dehydrogenase